MGIEARGMLIESSLVQNWLVWSLNFQIMPGLVLKFSNHARILLWVQEVFVCNLKNAIFCVKLKQTHRSDPQHRLLVFSPNALWFVRPTPSSPPVPKAPVLSLEETKCTAWTERNTGGASFSCYPVFQTGTASPVTCIRFRFVASSQPGSCDTAYDVTMMCL